MGRTLYLRCDSGISGDMVVGALLDLGASEKGMREALSSLGLGGFEVRVSRRTCGAVDACDFDVELDHAHENHDHDMDYLYGDLDGDGVHHAHAHHDHDEHDGHEGHDHHHHEHRTPAEVAAILDAAELPDRTLATAHRIFDILAVAEAKAHGTSVNEVHFHEVGAVDSIVDVVAAAWCLDDLDVTDAVVSPLAEGEGRVRTAHGVLGVPVPAVANIVAREGLVLSRLHRDGEFVTPTGAAIAAAIRTRDELPERYRVLASGVGSGKRAYDPPSTVCAMIVEEVAAPKSVPQAVSASAEPDLWKLETEVDDCTGEALGHLLSHLYETGAREAHFLPVVMKKGRPGYQVEVLCDEDEIPCLERVIFEDTTTIGIRRTPLWRTVLPREQIELSTPHGVILAKRVTLPSGAVRVYPEYESVSETSRGVGVPYQDVYRAAVAAAERARLV
jgi:uncharacterized protein (TIGR00299 family) protein